MPVYSRANTKQGKQVDMQDINLENTLKKISQKRSNLQERASSMSAADLANIIHILLSKAGESWAIGDLQGSYEAMMDIAAWAMVGVESQSRLSSIPLEGAGLIDAIKNLHHPEYCGVGEGMAAIRHQSREIDQTIEAGIFGGSRIVGSMLEISATAISVLLQPDCKPSTAPRSP